MSLQPMVRRIGWHRIVMIVAMVIIPLGLGARSEVAAAAVSGQQEAWGEWGTEPGKLFDPSMLGVDASDGSVYVSNLSPSNDEVVIQKFSEQGILEGSTSLPWIAGTNGFVGIAVDHARERFYVLEDAIGLDSRNEGEFVATKILAFSTQPDSSGNLTQVAELPVPPVGEEETLFEPREIALDPSTGDLVVLAKDSAGRVVLQRIETSGDGQVGARYLETGSTLNTEVDFTIDTQGTTYVLTDDPVLTGDEATRAYTLSGDFAAASLSPVPGFAAAAASEDWPKQNDFAAEPVFIGQGLGFGPQVAIVSSADGERTLYWKGVENPSSGVEAGAYVVHGYSLSDEATSQAFGKGQVEGSCEIETRFAALGAGSDGSLVVLDQGQLVGPESLPEWFPVVFRFGAGGSDCPAPAASIKLTEGDGGPPVSTVPAGTTVTLDGSGSELNGQTLSEMTWKIEGESGGPVIAHGEKVDHLFAEPGTYTVRLNMKTSAFLPIGTNFAASPTKLVVTEGGGEPEFKLTVTRAGTGTGEVTGGSTERPNTIECGAGAGCEHEYKQNDLVKLKATPTAGSSFAGWSGCTAVVGHPDECEVTISASQAVTASFDPPVAPEFKLTVTRAGTGTGEVTGGSTERPNTIECGAGAGCEHEYKQNDLVKLKATPTAGSSFAGWSGCTALGGHPDECELPISAVRAVTATFNSAAPIKFTLKVLRAGAGAGTLSGGSAAEPDTITCGAGCEHEYASGTVVNLSAAAAGGSTFAGWSGAGCSGTGACSVTMSAAREVTATFNPTSEGPETTPPGGGQVPPPPVPGPSTPPLPGSAGKTPAQLLRERRQKALKRCKKLPSRPRAKCLRHAAQIGKPKKMRSSRNRGGGSLLLTSGWSLAGLLPTSVDRPLAHS